MKRLLIIICLVSLFISGIAQNKSEDIPVLFKQTFKEVADARKQGNYKQGEKLWFRLLKKYNSLPEDIKNKYKWTEANIYYNLACLHSLLNKDKEAITTLRKAIDSGWSGYNGCSGYNWILKDSDFDNMRQNKEFQSLIQSLKEMYDYPYILSQSGKYTSENTDSLPAFTYMNPNDSNLVRIREYFNLDSIAGCGDEISKIKNLLLWVHNIVPHDGNSYNPKEKNTIAIVNLCKAENRGVNCRMLAQMLNECYLAMGFKSRYVTCNPKVYINDCHVINAVYSNTLDKWLWMDPTNNAYVMDENGNLLGIAEVRERLRKNLPLVLNEDANWNNKEKQTKESYLDSYMAKNLYYVTCITTSEYNAETNYEGKKARIYIDLVPSGFVPDKKLRGQYQTSNPSYFWQSPYQN